MSPFRPAATRLQRLRQTLGSLGMGNSLLYWMDRAASRLSHGHARVVKYLIVAQPIGTASALGLRAGLSTRIEPAAVSHPLTVNFPRPPSAIAQRYANGAQCLVASVKSQFAGYLWWQRDHYDEDEVRCRFQLVQPAVSAWDFDVYVEPRYRLGRTLVLLWQAAENQFRQDGVSWSFSRISAFNAESLATHARLGAVVRARALFLVLGPLQLSFFDQWPVAHLSLSASKRPVLRLTPPLTPVTGAPAADAR